MENAEIVNHEDNVNEVSMNLPDNKDFVDTDASKKGSKKKRRSSSPIRRFPNYSIKEILTIPNLIKENNGGNPWDTEQVALALGIKKGGNTFYYVTAASRDYGFTLGTRETKNIELTELGRKYVYASSQTEQDECIQEAFFNVDLFKKVYDYYNGSEPADDTFFKNTLISNFKLDESFLDDFINIYRENKNFVLCSSTNGKQNDTSAKNDTSIISTPKPNKDNKKLFVIMPFSEKTGNYPTGFFKEVFNQLIKPSAEDIGLIAETADKDGSDIIHSTIVKAIYNAEIILADLTEHNPNVLFELGLAIA